MAAGIHGEYHDIAHTDISHMFNNVRKNFGMGDRKQNLNPYDMSGNPNMDVDLRGDDDDLSEEGDEEFYAVLFNLDISGSMRGHKWDVCRHAVVDFIRYLNEDDIVSSIVFNDYPHLVMHWSTRQSKMALGQLTNFQSLQQALVKQQKQ
jgi:Mg-chelatase subunit ChlD